jgi:hypothetical protein
MPFQMALPTDTRFWRRDAAASSRERPLPTQLSQFRWSSAMTGKGCQRASPIKHPHQRADQRADTPVTMPAGASQSFVFALTELHHTLLTDVLQFSCDLAINRPIFERSRTSWFHPGTAKVPVSALSSRRPQRPLHGLGRSGPIRCARALLFCSGRCRENPGPGRTTGVGKWYPRRLSGLSGGRSGSTRGRGRLSRPDIDRRRGVSGRSRRAGSHSAGRGHDDHVRDTERAVLSDVTRAAENLG